MAPGAIVSPQAPVPPLAAPLPPRSRPRRSAGKDSGRRTSNYRGVSFHKPSGKWRVRIKVGSQEVRLGYFATELDAAKRYDQAASQYHGADAWLNFGEAGAAAAPPAGALAAPATHKAAACQPASAAARASAGRQRKQKPQQLQVDVAMAQQQQQQPSDGVACGLGPRQSSSGSVATTTPPATPGSPTSVLGATASGAATATVSMMPPPAACTGETASSRGLAPKAAAMPLLPDDRSREAFFAASLLLGMR